MCYYSNRLIEVYMVDYPKHYFISYKPEKNIISHYYIHLDEGFINRYENGILNCVYYGNNNKTV